MAIEYEVRFLEINKMEIIHKLRDMGAEDLGEDILEEIIFYGDDWREKNMFIRIRKRGNNIRLSYKHHTAMTIDGTIEHEVVISDIENMCEILKATGLELSRRQQKLRHTFKLPGVTFDIDTWPRIPAYIEIEGENETIIRESAEKLGLDWKDVKYENAGKVLKKFYNLDLVNSKDFVF